MEVFADLIQNTDEWLKVRAGMQTSSKFQEVQLKPGPRGGIPKTRETYKYDLAGERLTGQPMPHYISADMERGHEREAEAGRLHQMLYDVEHVHVGFIKNGNCGGSPDALIDSDGMWENKDAIPRIQIERLEAGVVPPEHETQLQGLLMVAQRQWIYFQSTCRGLPPLIIRVDRDERFIAALRVDIDEFEGELNELVAKIRSM